MELGHNFTSKIEYYLLTGKNAKGAAAAKLIQDATAAPGVFVFSELLEMPNVQELAKSESHAKSYALLQLFAYKTYQDYLQHKDELPELNKAQITKLKHLSIVTMASERRILPYADLLKALDMSNVRELEDLIIDAIYVDILRGKLDQRENQLEIEYTMGRDLEPGKLESILSALTDWAGATNAVLATLDSKISALSANATKAKRDQEESERTLQNMIKEAQDKVKEKNSAGASSSQQGGGSGFGSAGRRLGGGGGGGEIPGDFIMENPSGPRLRENSSRMDVDDPEGMRGKSRKSPQDSKQRKRNRG